MSDWLAIPLGILAALVIWVVFILSWAIVGG